MNRLFSSHPCQIHPIQLWGVEREREREGARMRERGIDRYIERRETDREKRIYRQTDRDRERERLLYDERIGWLAGCAACGG